MIKQYSVTFKLPQLSASHTWHSVEVEAPDFGMAAKRGWQEIKKRQHVKGKRVSYAEIKVDRLD